MPVAWSWAFDTPYKWTKQIPSFFGGTRQGMAISWPGHITDKGGFRNQFAHVIDIVPTLLEMTGIPAPVMVDGIGQKPIEGVSLVHIRQGECGRTIAAPYPVFRDDGRAGAIQRWLDAECGPDPSAMGLGGKGRH